MKNTWQPILIFLTLVLVAGCNSSEEPVRSWEHSAQGTLDAALDAFGQNALVATLDKGTLYWDLRNNKVLFSLSHKSNQKTLHRLVRIAEKGNIAVTADDQSIAVWNTQSGESLGFWALPASPLDMAITQDGRFALIGFTDNQARMIDLMTGNTLRTFEHAAQVSAVAFSPNEKIVIIGSDDTAARVWDLPSGEMLFQWFLPYKITKVAISPNNQYALISASQSRSEIRSLVTGEKVSDIKLHPTWLPTFLTAPLTLSSVLFSEDSQTLFTGSPPRNIRQWDVSTGRLEKQWVIPKRYFMKPMPAVSLTLAIDSNKNLVTEASNGMGYEFLLEQ